MADPTLIDKVDCDILIVGAGSSGCVLASRLVRQGLKVLLVEKGPANSARLGKLVTRTSKWLQAASGGGLSDKFMTVPQSGLGNRRLPAFRGLGGGGTSNVNAGIYLRGRKKDYADHWPWKLEDVEASFKSVEAELTLEEPKPSANIGPSWDRMFEEIGFERCSPAGSSSDAQGSGNEPTWTKEGIGGSPLRSTTINGGERQSAWRAFVRPVTTMPNLRIKDDVTVSRVILEGGRAVGIEISEFLPAWKGGGRRVQQLRLAKEAAEIVLCCGVFRTPKLLMLSGVGPREHLEEKGVSVVADLPHVGGNLCDHLLLATMNVSKVPMAETDYSENGNHGMAYFSFGLPRPETSDSIADDGNGGDAVSTPRTSAVLGFMHNDGGTAYLIPLILRMMFTEPGFLATLMREAIAALVWILLRFTPLGWLLRRTRGTVVLLTTVKSRGTVRLASKDPAAPPLIDPAYLTHPEDRQAMCAALHAVRRARTETPTSKAVLGYDLAPGKTYNYCKDDESCLRFAREKSLTFFHPIGTCRMGEHAGDSVVSSDNLRVHGVAGLRVADASIAPHIPVTPTQAMAMMIGDRAAAIVLKDRFAKEQVQERWREAAGSSLD